MAESEKPVYWDLNAVAKEVMPQQAWPPTELAIGMGGHSLL